MSFPFRPRVVGWELTLRCNMRCLHCGSSAGAPRPGELSEAEGLGLISQLVDLGAEVLTLSGGEPLLHPSWGKYARKLVDSGVSTYMITNALLLEENIPKVLDSGLRRIGVSIDGMEVAHDRIRNHPGSFACALRAALAAKKAGLSVGAVTHVSKANAKDLEAMHRAFSDAGLDYWQVQITFKQGRMKEHEDFSLDPSELPGLSLFVHEKQRAKGGLKVVAGDNLGYYCSPPIRDKEWKGCFAGRHLAGIDADGSVKGCLSLPREFVEGNVRKEPLRKIWEDPQRFKFNRYFSPDMLEGSCKGCPKAKPCRAGCAVTAYSATGSRFNNPYCVFGVLRGRKNP
ncbi:MAG: radical SAM protein [Elusimicrobia bacterium]|nr:radical SAM protein [Elusimicrobiota bacterium]